MVCVCMCVGSNTKMKVTNVETNVEGGLKPEETRVLQLIVHCCGCFK